jgi:hypothetical protein
MIDPDNGERLLGEVIVSSYEEAIDPGLRWLRRAPT